jgi:hypothetical protein
MVTSMSKGKVILIGVWATVIAALGILLTVYTQSPIPLIVLAGLIMPAYFISMSIVFSDPVL